ncbi:MAG: hypothetical protein AAB558_02415 [Patescibacteria group bacterium]
MNIKHLSFGLTLAASLVWLGAICPLPANVGTTNSALTVSNAEIPDLEPLVAGPENLMGSWKSACLIPDQNSDYAEQHYFTFYANGIALHKRETFYKKACTGSDMTLVNNYSFTVPTNGQINFTDLETGQTFYDIYTQTGTNLLFGHGFRNSAEPVGNMGASESARFASINSYIVYSKTAE